MYWSIFILLLASTFYSVYATYTVVSQNTLSAFTGLPRYSLKSQYFPDKIVSRLGTSTSPDTTAATAHFRVTSTVDATSYDITLSDITSGYTTITCDSLSTDTSTINGLGCSFAIMSTGIYISIKTTTGSPSFYVARFAFDGTYQSMHTGLPLTTPVDFSEFNDEASNLLFVKIGTSLYKVDVSVSWDIVTSVTSFATTVRSMIFSSYSNRVYTLEGLLILKAYDITLPANPSTGFISIGALPVAYSSLMHKFVIDSVTHNIYWYDYTPSTTFKWYKFPDSATFGTLTSKSFVVSTATAALIAAGHTNLIGVTANRMFLHFVDNSGSEITRSSDVTNVNDVGQSIATGCISLSHSTSGSPVGFQGAYKNVAYAYTKNLQFCVTNPSASSTTRTISVFDPAPAVSTSIFTTTAAPSGWPADTNPTLFYNDATNTLTVITQHQTTILTSGTPCVGSWVGSGTCTSRCMYYDGVTTETYTVTQQPTTPFVCSITAGTTREVACVGADNCGLYCDSRTVDGACVTCDNADYVTQDSNGNCLQCLNHAVSTPSEQTDPPSEPACDLCEQGYTASYGQDINPYGNVYATCTLTPTPTSTPTSTPESTITPTPTPTPRCGDGNVDSGEYCDDGNAIDNDACSNTCEKNCVYSEWSVCPVPCFSSTNPSPQITRTVSQQPSQNGIQCTQTLSQDCPNIASCCAQPCGIHGVCEGTTIGSGCSCLDNYHGDTCSNLDCVFTPITPIDPSPCSATCGIGTQTVTAYEIQHQAEGTGTPCPDVQVVRECNLGPCGTPVDCVVSIWSEWSECSATCGEGTETRTRAVVTPAAHCGADCPPLFENRACTRPACYECGNHIVEHGETCDDGNSVGGDGCSVQCQIEHGWTCDVTPCAPICGDGRRYAHEACDDGNLVNGDGCSNTCTVEPDYHCEGSAPSVCTHIPIDCVGLFGSFSECSKSCGGGIRTRKYIVVVPEQYGGHECPHPHDFPEVENCNTQPCPVDCQVSEWTVWSACSKTCGGGTHTRTRTITQLPSTDGLQCPDLEETHECNTQECPIDCQFTTEMSIWLCDVHTGTQVVTVTNTITQPALHGGTTCPAEEVHTTQTCSVNCIVGEWSDWTACEVTCSGGCEQTRTRSTILPLNGGLECPVSTESRVCPAGSCPLPVDCVGEFAFSTCSATCGDGTQEGVFHITQQAQNNGIECSINENDIIYRPCNIGPCPGDVVDCVGEYVYETCSVSCGLGTQNGVFRITTAAHNGGNVCAAVEGNTVSRSCNLGTCPVVVDCVGEYVYESCSATCGPGTEKGVFRITTAAQNGGNECVIAEGNEVFRPCNRGDCPVPVNCVGEYVYGPCSTTCGLGVEKGVFHITTAAENGGDDCTIAEGNEVFRACKLCDCVHSESSSDDDHDSSSNSHDSSSSSHDSSSNSHDSSSNSHDSSSDNHDSSSNSHGSSSDNHDSSSNSHDSSSNSHDSSSNSHDSSSNSHDSSSSGQSGEKGSSRGKSSNLRYNARKHRSSTTNIVRSNPLSMLENGTKPNPVERPVEHAIETKTVTDTAHSDPSSENTDTSHLPITVLAAVAVLSVVAVVAGIGTCVSYSV